MTDTDNRIMGYKEKVYIFPKLEVTTKAHYDLYLAPIAIYSISFSDKQFSVPEHNMITFYIFDLSYLCYFRKSPPLLLLHTDVECSLSLNSTLIPG